MASMQVVMFFKDKGGFGWSETFWYSGPTDATTATGNANTLTVNRCAILASDCNITHVRIATAVKRNPLILSVGGGTVFPGGETPPAAPAEVALLARFQAGTSGYNRPFLRGIPLRVVQDDDYTPDAAFTANLNAFYNALTAGPWNARGTLGSPTAHLAITTPTPTPPRGYSFTSATLAGATGDVIRVHGCKVPGYNGLKKIVAAGGTSYNVGGAAPAVADTSTSSYATKINYFDAKIDLCQTEGLTRRAAGRPFGQSRGRRQTLYSLRQ